MCYYQSNRPGACFSMQVLLMLLWALLKAGMVSDVLSVLSVSLTHKIVVSVVLIIFLFYPSVQSKCAAAVRPAVQKGALFRSVGNTRFYSNNPSQWALEWMLNSFLSSPPIAADS